MENIKIAKNLLKSSFTTVDVLWLIMLHNDWNVDKKFQPFVFNSHKENHISPIDYGLTVTDGQT